MSLPQSVLESETAQAVFVYKGNEYPVNIQGMTPNSAGYYVFTYRIPAKEFANTIGLKFVDGDETILMVYPSGKVVPGNVLNYSAQTYCENFSGTGTAKDLVDALHNYCAYAYRGLTQDPTDVEPTFAEEHDVSSVTVDDLVPYKASKTGSVEGLTLSSYSLTLLTTTEVNLKFNLATGHTIGEYSFVLDGQEATAVKIGSNYVVTIPDIGAKDLDEKHTLVVSKGDETMSVFCYGLSYCHTVLNSSNSTDEMKDTVRALFLYNQAANEYFKNS